MSNGYYTREENVREILELREQGLTHREIAERTGLSKRSVNNYICDPDGSKAQARKLRYAGTCLICGARTDGSGGRKKAPLYCNSHQWLNPDRKRQSHQRWDRDKLIAAIREWADVYGEPPAMADWNPHQARFALGDEDRAVRFLTQRDRWPWFTSVVYHFGSWNAGIRAAGFEPRANHGGADNQSRRKVGGEAA